ncbi:MAG: TonB-dependent receptor [Melioribacteraceae bacterium]|nr:TonB-dependent receptor [Melioribacteraceae bacterium]MCF8266039.1 TonB-dependent receptor [Melioribacteraceae bacterium]MCF8413421.1 TonB-dependent receptor [Melioribacteraceae bacterium]
MNRIMTFNRISLIMILLVAFSQNIFAGQTGKIAGKVLDRETGEAVIGANIIVEGTYLGAAADIDGYYYINNVPPGTYNVVISAIGYSKTIVTDVRIKIDLTTNIDVELVSEAISLGDDIVVVADRPLIQKDLTSTAATVSSDEIEMLPVDNVQQVINLQAGVVGGHFRGGRSNEVAYLIDGIPVTDVYSGTSSVQVENSSIRQLEVISGTFNAEYGQALSGVVNIVTKEGASNYEGFVAAYLGTHYSTHTDIFQNLDKINSDGLMDINLSLSGPTKLVNGLNFFINGRFVDDDGYYYGQRIYNVTDSDPFTPTGDGEFVPMSTYRKFSFNGKLSYNLPSWKFAYSLFWDDNKNRYYDHGYRWTPDGITNHFRDNIVNNVQIQYVPSQSTITQLKFASNLYRYKGYLHADPFDPAYVNPYQGQPTSNYTFRSGGNQVDRYNRHTLTYIAQWSLESQLSKEHKVKIGAEGQFHSLFNHWRTIVNLTEGQIDEAGNEIFTLGYRNEGTSQNTKYTKSPWQLSAYIQDKMEYENMIINAGLRFDYFEPNQTMPVDLKNPYQTILTEGNTVVGNPAFPGAGITRDADAKYQVSPRIGVSFPISDQGAIYFSYGHFFQIPNFENLYRNELYLIDQGQALNSITGNPDLKAQKTVKYELGLQQVVFPDVSLDITVYYSDIRNLLGTEIINTYEGFKYARFINKDYGNVKGTILTLDKRFTGFFSAKIDYTYQVAEGNSSDPLSVYNDNQSDPPVESEKKVVPLNWDQKSTINFTTTFGEPGNWTVSLLMGYGSGMPYTEDVLISNGVRFENGGRRPTTFNVDLKADKFFDVFGFKVHTYLLVYNVFDIKNEYGVYSTTGRATYDLNVKFAGEINGLNTYEQYINNPQMYSSPRQIRFGFSFGF